MFGSQVTNYSGVINFFLFKKLEKNLVQICVQVQRTSQGIIKTVKKEMISFYSPSVDDRK
jgi:hypothetical protein